VPLIRTSTLARLRVADGVASYRWQSHVDTAGNTDGRASIASSSIGNGSHPFAVPASSVLSSLLKRHPRSHRRDRRRLSKTHSCLPNEHLSRSESQRANSQPRPKPQPRAGIPDPMMDLEWLIDTPSIGFSTPTRSARRGRSVLRRDFIGVDFGPRLPAACIGSSPISIADWMERRAGALVALVARGLILLRRPLIGRRSGTATARHRSGHGQQNQNRQTELHESPPELLIAVRIGLVGVWLHPSATIQTLPAASGMNGGAIVQASKGH
jgi:hypothetical protein